MPIKRGVDWVAVVEIAYEPAADDRAWASRMMELCSTIFGDSRQLGFIAVEHDARCAAIKVPIALGMTPMASDVRHALTTFGPRLIRDLFYPPAPVTTQLVASQGLPPEARDHMVAFRSRWRFADAIGLCVHPDPGMAVVLCANYDERVSLSRDGRRLLTQLALHLETGFRLRHRPESLQAVISPDGRVLHREDAALPTALLREQVARIESARTRRRRATADAIDLWSALVAGRFSLVARTEGSRRHYLVVENAPLTQPIRALTPGELDAVSAAARGLSTKLVSYGLGVSRSVISSRLASAATKIGAATRIELVRIAAMLTRDPRARFADIALTATEKDVLALLAQGLSNREIAALRNRSMRTIANQVAQLLRKSKAHSRQALVARLLTTSDS